LNNALHLAARVQVMYPGLGQEHYRRKLAEQFGYKNRMQVPMITKVVLNMGIGEGVADRKKVDGAAIDMSMIAGVRTRGWMARRRPPPGALGAPGRCGSAGSNRRHAGRRRCVEVPGTDPG